MVDTNPTSSGTGDIAPSLTASVGGQRLTLTDDLLIENVAVAPDFQRRGFGRTLIAHAEEIAAQAERARVRLYTNSRFEENLRLYASLGYVVERKELLNGGVAVHMVKQID